MNFTYTQIGLFFVVIILVACGKTNAPAPDFDIESSQLKLSDSQKSELEINRGENSQIQFTIAPRGSAHPIVRVEKSILCDSILIQGQKKQAPDPTLFQFSISGHEFPTLAIAAFEKTDCKLNVKATDDVGSTYIRHVPVTLQLQGAGDVTDLFKAQHQTLEQRIYASTSARHEILIESYALTNTTNQTLTFLFRPRQDYLIYKMLHMDRPNTGGGELTTVIRSTHHGSLSGAAMTASYIVIESSTATNTVMGSETRLILLPHMSVALKAFLSTLPFQNELNFENLLTLGTCLPMGNPPCVFKTEMVEILNKSVAPSLFLVAPVTTTQQALSQSTTAPSSKSPQEILIPLKVKETPLP